MNQLTVREPTMEERARAASSWPEVLRKWIELYGREAIYEQREKEKRRGGK